MKKKAVTIERNGKVIAVFSSISNTARCMGYTETTIRKWISGGTNKFGVLFRFASDKEMAFIKNMNNLSLEDSISEPPEKMHEPKPVARKVRSEDPYADDDELDDGKFVIVPYELTMGRVCSTVCPYREFPKPKVGSGACMKCPSFHGRSRRRQQVACSAAKGHAWNRDKL